VAPCRRPDIRHLRLLAKDLLRETDRLAPPAFAGQIHSHSIALENLTFVLRIGQGFAWRYCCGASADVTEGLQPLAGIG